jgi:hypothetical protein
MTKTEAFEETHAQIRFFMATTVRASFGYLTALAAVLTTSSSSYVQTAAETMGTTPAVLISETVLVLNLFYFTLVGGCLFAVLKRGLFILETGNEGTSVCWETFSRLQRSRGKLWANAAGRVAWNIDNLYMVPLFAVLAAGSLAASAIAIDRASAWPLALAFALIVLHAVPGAMLFYVFALNRECQVAVIANVR